ncbi:IclR family transcriptional regulator [Kocuria varians]|uniref:Glycerol operon regulatory protein n=1 Tax=Kocuria varians TaxID=1272 RepID=A0A4Y4D0P3_KOCVA|nr:IclR family transcriptional regulator [Kocuria varians]GEC98156.1 IclR family transcriptional regulator [Kocuria varians]
MAAASRTESTTESRTTPVIANAVSVLRCFTHDDPLLGVTEIAGRIGLHKSTVSRILATLEQENLVERDPQTRRYGLGLGLITLAGPLLADLDERRVAYPVLQELTAQTGETSALVVWNGAETVCVEQIPSPQEIKHTIPLGTRYDTALSSSVQVFLAAQPAERVRALLLAGTVTHLATTEDAIESYLQQLATVRDEGVAVNYGRTHVDEVGVAAPVRDHRNETVAAVMIAAPRYRVTEDQVSHLVAACTAAAEEVSQRLGHSPRED